MKKITKIPKKKVPKKKVLKPKVPKKKVLKKKVLKKKPKPKNIKPTKRTCRKKTTVEYKRRPEPPYVACECKFAKKKGNDGNTYVSFSDTGEDSDFEWIRESGKPMLVYVEDEIYSEKYISVSFKPHFGKPKGTKFIFMEMLYYSRVDKTDRQFYVPTFVRDDGAPRSMDGNNKIDGIEARKLIRDGYKVYVVFGLPKRFEN